MAVVTDPSRRKRNYGDGLSVCTDWRVKRRLVGGRGSPVESEPGQLAEGVRVVADVVLVEVGVLGEVRVQVGAVVDEQVDRVLRLAPVPPVARVVQLVHEHVHAEAQPHPVDEMRPAV